MVKKILIIGLGNEYVSDDGVGIKTVRELQKKITDIDEVPIWMDIKFDETAIGGLGMLDLIIGNDICIIIDAIYTQKNKVGTLYRFVQRTDKEIQNIKSSHQMNLSQVLSLGKLLSYKIPKIVVVYGIEVDDVTTFNENCTTEVQKAIRNLTALVYNDLVNFNIEKIPDEPLSVYFEDELT